MKAVLLVGSPRGERSTSASLGRYLLGRLREKGWRSDEMFVLKALRSAEGQDALVAAVDAADLVVLSFPLYVDALPAPVIRAMDVIVREREAGKRTPLVALVNNGFIEASQDDIALRMCRLFARDAGLKWWGGLALGGGPAVDGRPLSEAGGMVRNVRASLDLAAGALAEGRPVPPEAVELMARPLTPQWLFFHLGNMGWKQQARRNKVRGRLYDRPFAKEKE